jgi:hypothetical protein
MRTPRGFSAKLEQDNRRSLSLRSGKLRNRQSPAKTNRLSHPSHGVLQSFEFTFQIKVLDLVPIQVRVKEFYGINLRAASVTCGCLIDDIVKVDIRISCAL